MESLAILFVLGLAFLILVLPIFAAIRATRASRRADDLERRLARMEDEFARLARTARGESGEALPQLAPTPLSDASIVPEPAVPHAAKAPLEPAVPPAFASPSRAPASSRTAPAPPPLPPGLEPKPVASPPAAPVRKPLPAVNWEQFMGVKLFAWLGGFALFLAAAYFVKYSFEHNLIPPEVRVALGFLLGIGLVGGGVLMRARRYQVTAHTLSGTGIVILYAVSFACHAVYRFPFFGQVPTFLLMALITATAFTLSIRLNAIVIAVLGFAGGFLTPVLLSSGQDRAAGLFTYVGLLDLGLVAVALRRRWTFLAALGALGTVLMQLGWVSRFFAVGKVYTALAVFLSFNALFVSAAWLARRREQLDRWIEGAAAGLPLVTFGFALYLLSFRTLGQAPGRIFAFVLGADLCLLALAWLRPKLAPLQLLGGALSFVLLAAWMGIHLDHSLLYWALGLCMVFAILHSVHPLALDRLRPGTSPTWWAHLFPPAALLLIMLPILRLTEISFAVWPAMLLVDALAILLAVATVSITSIVAVLLLSAVGILLWLVRAPLVVGDLPVMLVVVAGFALFFFVIGSWASRRILNRTAAGAAPGGSGAPAFLRWTGQGLPFDLQAQIPALSATLPFLLLVMVVLRLPLTNPSPVFGLALLMVLLLLGVARTFTLPLLGAVALGCTLALEHAWHFSTLPKSGTPMVALGWYLVFFAVFVAFPFVCQSRFPGRALPWAVGALAGPLHFYMVHSLVKLHYGSALSGYLGLLPAAFSVPMFACLAVLLKRFPADHRERNTVLAWFGGAALFFITLIFPIQFDRQWITIGWALEGMALCWLFHRVPHPGLRLVGAGLLAVAFTRLAFNPAVFSYQPRSATPIFNWYLYAYGLTTAALFAAARLLAPPRHLIAGRDVRPLLLSLGTVLAFLLLNIEIADYFTAAGESRLAFRFSGNFARDMSYSIAWALFALVLVIAGLLRQIRPARYAGLALLAITLLKLFFHDLAELKQLYRIGALAGVAVIAIVASFLYQRFQAQPASSDEDKPNPDNASAPS